MVGIVELVARGCAVVVMEKRRRGSAADRRGKRCIVLDGFVDAG